ncbi:copper amine oxidase N-terminal domain-containing protein [Anaerotignum sp.]
MKKKTLCNILAAVMLFSLCPATALAKEEPLQTIKESIDLREEKNEISGDGWEWDGDDTLTLTDFRAKVPSGTLEEEALFYLPDDVKVEIEGEDNVIDNRSYRCDVFYCEGEVIFEGDGYIEITVDSSSASAIYAKGGPVIFRDKLEMFVDSDGYIMYIKDAKGTEPIISVTDKAIVSFPDDVDKDVITIVRKSKTNSNTSNWFNYKEYFDDWDETINLIPKNAKVVNDKVKPDTEEPKEEVPAVPEKDTYQITIGSPAIVKNGTVSYTADVSPYLSNGYTMLPLRALLNVTGDNVDITWDAVTKTITVIEKNDTDSQYANLIYVVIGEKQMVHGPENIDMSTPAELSGGRTFVSLRDWMNILSALNMPASDLNWDTKTKTVTLKY